jgi:hypothetical protein
MFYEKINSDLSLIDERIKYLLAYAVYNPDVIVFDEIKAKIIGFTDFTDNNPVRVVTEDNTMIDVMLNQIKLVLLPLSDLDDDENTPEFLQDCTYSFVVYLIENHYDVFGLIDKGLAVDYNTVFPKSDVL